MSMLNIHTYPDPILKELAKSVDEVDVSIRRLLDDMAETMHANAGIGLAAPQVGVSKRVIIVDIDPTEDKEPASNLIEFVNPKITEHDGEIEWEEGCLSVPEFTVKIKRLEKIKVEALDRNGKEFTLDAEGLLSIAIQHELDHLNGKLIVDHASRLKRDLYLRKIKKTAIL